jgi:hypothetical protein
MLVGMLAAPAILALLAWCACNCVKMSSNASARSALEENIRRGIYADPVCESCGEALDAAHTRGACVRK